MDSNIKKRLGRTEPYEGLFNRNYMISLTHNTVLSRGMRFDYKWHGIAPNKEQAKQLLRELRMLGGKVRSEHE